MVIFRFHDHIHRTKPDGIYEGMVKQLGWENYRIETDKGYMAHVRMLERDDVDVVIAGEVPEWESIPYVRDAVSAGLNKAMILVGHVNSEEGGMIY